MPGSTSYWKAFNLCESVTIEVNTIKMPKVGLIGAGISLAGALPLGVLNATAMYLSMERGFSAALTFSCGVVLIEMAYLVVTLYALDWIRAYRISSHMKTLSIITFLLIAIACLYQAYNPSPASPAYVGTGGYFAQGALLSAVNPAQVPFWIGWNTLLISKGLLHPNRKSYPAYIAGAGIGTFIGLGLFILAGELVQEHFLLNWRWVNLILGLVFIVSAVLQLPLRSLNQAGR